MLKIRLTRRGKKNRAFFRIVVAEAAALIKGRFIEIVGFLDPVEKKASLKEERIKYWLGHGAKPSDTVHNLLVEHKIIVGPKIKKFGYKKKKGEETHKEEIKAETGAETKPAESDEKPAEIKEEAPEKTTKDKEGKPEEVKKVETAKIEPLPTEKLKGE